MSCGIAAEPAQKRDELRRVHLPCRHLEIAESARARKSAGRQIVRAVGNELAELCSVGEFRDDFGIGSIAADYPVAPAQPFIAQPGDWGPLRWLFRGIVEVIERLGLDAAGKRIDFADCKAAVRQFEFRLHQPEFLELEVERLFVAAQRPGGRGPKRAGTRRSTQ